MHHRYLTLDSSGQWNITPPISAEEMLDVNCHKFALFVGGYISREELVSNSRLQREHDPHSDFTFGKRAEAISDKAFVPIVDAETLQIYARTSCDAGKPYIGQIRDSKTGEMAHSFIVEKDASGNFYCFDKAGFKQAFGVYPIKDLFTFKNYHNQEWRFVPLHDVS